MSRHSASMRLHRREGTTPQCHHQMGSVASALRKASLTSAAPFFANTATVFVHTRPYNHARLAIACASPRERRIRNMLCVQRILESTPNSCSATPGQGVVFLTPRLFNLMCRLDGQPVLQLWWHEGSRGRQFLRYLSAEKGDAR